MASLCDSDENQPPYLVDDDPDFSELGVGAARLRKSADSASQQQAAFTQQAISASFAAVSSVDELRRRGTVLQVPES